MRQESELCSATDLSIDIESEYSVRSTFQFQNFFTLNMHFEFRDFQ